MFDLQQPQPTPSRTFPWRWAVAGFVSFCGIIALLIGLGHQNSLAEFERNQRRRESESFQAIKSGESQVTVSQSSKVLFMLADDPECIRNLTSVYFFMTDLSDPSFSVTTKLSNVNDIGIYDCQGVTAFIKSIKGFPSINSVYFESVTIDDDLLIALASFPNLKKVRFEQLLNEHQIELLSQTLPDALIEVADPVSDEPKQIQDGTP